MSEPLFSPGTDTRFRIALGLAAVAPILTIVGLMVLARSPLGRSSFEPVEQPVAFDHRHHAADEGIDCRYCHDTVMRSATAGFPPSSRCMGCHAQIWSDSPALADVRESFFQDRPIAWNRVHRVPDFAFFNHASHVNKGVGCVTCHGRVDTMARVEKVASLTMGWCLDCHRDPTPHLRPLSEITSMTWNPDGNASMRGAELARLLHVQTRTNCTTCHR